MEAITVIDNFYFIDKVVTTLQTRPYVLVVALYQHHQYQYQYHQYQQYQYHQYQQHLTGCEASQESRRWWQLWESAGRMSRVLRSDFNGW